MEQQKQLLISASEELGSDGQLADACASVGDSTSTQTPATVPHSARVELEGAQSEAEETCALVEFVRGALEDACREQERAERERVEVERQRREKAEKERVEKEERDRERKVLTLSYSYEQSCEGFPWHLPWG